MPYEHQLRKLVEGFTNTSIDFAAWAKAMDLRAAAVGGKPFAGTQYISPPPKNIKAYRQLSDSLQNVAVLLAIIADCQEGMVAHVASAQKVNFSPARPSALGSALSEYELLRLILGWQDLDLGTFKTMMRQYGVEPHEHPKRLGPGATSDERLAEELVARLKVISQDVDNFIIQHNLKKGGPYAPSAASTVHDALVNVEQQYHRLMSNYLFLLNLLPYHLLNANP